MINIPALFTFKSPQMAVGALIIFVVAVGMAIAWADGVEKFGFQLCIGFGMGYVGLAAKAAISQFGRLGVLMLALGFGMISVGVIATPASVYQASVLDEIAIGIVPLGLAFFSRVEEG